MDITIHPVRPVYISLLIIIYLNECVTKDESKFYYIHTYMYSHLILQIQERHNDPLVFHHGIKARWTLATITAQRLIQQRVPEIQIPFLTLHGSADLVVNIASSYFLMEHTKSEDKMIKVCTVYACRGMLYALAQGWFMDI